MRPGTVIRVTWVDQTLEVSNLSELTVMRVEGSFIQFRHDERTFWVPRAAILEWVELETMDQAPIASRVARIQFAVPQFRALVQDREVTA